MKNKFQIAMSLAVIMSLVFNSLALADTFTNDVTAGGNDTIAVGGSTIITYKINATGGDGQTGCNVSDGTPATITITVPAAVTASTTTLTFTNCGVPGQKTVTYSSNTAGNYAITTSIADSGTGSYNNNADFTLHVLAPADSTPPVISYTVNGVYPMAPDGANGWFINDASVVWTVTDPESSVSLTGCVDTTINTDTTGTTLSCSATSAGGSAEPVSVTIKRDTVDPSVTVAPDTGPDHGSWYNNSISFNVSGTDATSGIASCDAAFNYSTPDSATAQVSGTCSDNAGHVGSDSHDFMYDGTLPEISFSVAPAPAGTGWYNLSTGAPTATFNCSDLTSNVASCEGPHLFGDGTNQSFTGYATDNAGNTNSATVTGINVDLTAPTITYVTRTVANSNGWNSTDVVVEWSCTDGGSGVVNAAVSTTVSTEGANQDAIGTCYDVAGNSSSNTVSGIDIDKTVPTASASAAPSANVNGWNNTNVTVSFNGNDGTGSGIDFCDPPVVLNAEGVNQSASGTCTDMAGNVSAPASVSGINIDKTAPTAYASAAPTPNGFGWNNTAVTVSFTGADELSGIDFCDAPVVLSSEGADQSASGICTDEAGNESISATANNIDIDLTLPSLTWNGGPADGGNYYFGFVPAAPTCTASDALSGPNGCAVSGHGTSVGAHTMTATAYDQADNSYSEDRNYTVSAWTLTGFYQPVDMPNPAVVWNTVRNGSTVPLKFEIFAGSTELTDVAAVDTLTYAQVQCNATSPQDEVETLATGNTVLRYDATAGQFIFNWKTPSGTAGKCFRVTMTTDDGSSLVAYFKMK